MNEHILKLVQHTSIAILVLGILVFVIHAGMQELALDRKIRDEQQKRMADVIISTMEESRSDRRELMVTIKDLAYRIINKQEYDEKMVQLLAETLIEQKEMRIELTSRLDAFMELKDDQTETVTRSIRKTR